MATTKLPPLGLCCSAAARKAGGAPWDRREGLKSLLLPLTIPAVHALVDGRAHPDTHIPTLVCAARAYVCSADVQDSAGARAAQHSGFTPNTDGHSTLA